MSLAELVKKLRGLVDIWARVVLGIGLIYCELFFRPGPSSQDGYPLQLYKAMRLLICRAIEISMCRASVSLVVVGNELFWITSFELELV